MSASVAASTSEDGDMVVQDLEVELWGKLRRRLSEDRIKCWFVDSAETWFNLSQFLHNRRVCRNEYTAFGIEETKLKQGVRGK